MHNARGRLSRLGFAWTFGGEVGDREAEGTEAEVERDGRARVEADDRVERQPLRLRNERRADEGAVLGEEDAAERSENPQPTTSPTPNLGPKSDESEPEPWKARPSSP